ncbi:ABC transporter permease [Clavibacter phaseoli]|uniref:ABC transporter permease n=1 Tax=Clavibacter phaseoli TaxID=1734031 RepID=UPI000E665BD6|nr:ABC transporter permease [Clavibacter phaseoli]RIJ55999.1 ABC transporter permease [Clavibacter phaseoli]UKF29627.1 ABC transporter permease [Clavibacter phaseoli]UKF38232.1 ABC transporter permease [Clavibacter phaseoli]
MRPLDLVRSAVANTFRSKTRLVLTILSIFVGAFTLTLTNGIGTGIDRYIASTVGAVGSSDTMTVTRASDDATAGPAPSGPREYDPDTVASGSATSRPGSTVVALTPDDITTLKGVDGVRAVQPTVSLATDWIAAGDGTRYVVGASGLAPGQTLTLTAGSAPDDASSALQVVLPTSYVGPLGFADDASAVGQTVTLAVTDAARAPHTVDATVVGVAEESIAAAAGSSVTTNQALTTALSTAADTGLPADQADRYAQATVTFDDSATDADVDALKTRLADAGYTGTTVADQLGTFQTVIDGIVLVLNGFAIIALLAASFGIVNTLFMSVQERTREIGLMKAMGQSSGKVFALFSIEAAFIGFLGSAVGVVIAVAAGTGISAALSSTVLSNLPGLTLIAFDPASIATIVLVVMAIAFLAGTLPAARAARADPVTSLRYE